MKIRMGFISNSSSSSFIFDKNEYSYDDLINYMSDNNVSYDLIDVPNKGDIVVKELNLKHYKRDAVIADGNEIIIHGDDYMLQGLKKLNYINKIFHG